MTSSHRISTRLNTKEDEIYIKISKILHDLSGINLGPEKVNLMKARLIKRLRETGAQKISDYLDLLNSPLAHEEFPHLISALTTNYTNFFREPHHFKVLRETVLPALEARGARTINIWSAGCSSGQEPISIAITLADCLGTAFRRVKILGTDIDREILTKASNFTYPEQETLGIPQPLLTKYFKESNHSYHLGSHISEAITYRELNLNSNWTMQGKHDVIFCRNVVIYFQQKNQAFVWEKIINNLSPGGFLLIGHSERIPDELRLSVEQFGPNSYRKH